MFCAVCQVAIVIKSKMHKGMCKICRQNINLRVHRLSKQGITANIEDLKKLGKGWRLRKGKPRAYYYAKQAVQRAFATPKWVDVEAVAEFYSNCPKGHHVDHIVPLRGLSVCGLHVPWNLQYLAADLNMKKKNHY